MIDLHSHTHYSDGSCSSEELLQLAAGAGLNALAVTDHDCFDGYERIITLPKPANMELVRGIEVTCREGSRTAHLLGYFLNGEPSAGFLQWMGDRHEQRRDRNRRLAARLREVGIPVELEEVEALGRSITGRPHFARVLINKGYARNIDEAFRGYLGEGGAAYVRHEAPPLAEGILRIREAGGLCSLAHPIRLGAAFGETFLATLTRQGLHALEVFHTDHSLEDRARYLMLARRYELRVTGGSDFHGAVKPGVRLGGAGVEDWVLEELRALIPGG
ncbi:MAG TPA: PHP domain-containing protein [Bryobacteraceae bacterium]|nr:PHP domain-containing protein [Bryobacteraceae bacterium]